MTAMGVNRIASGAVVVLFLILAVGYVRFNFGIDAAYAECRDSNEIAVCNCMAEGYAAQRNIFTQAPLLGAMIGPTLSEFDLHMAGVRVDCGVLA